MTTTGTIKTPGPNLRMAGKLRPLFKPYRYKILYGGRGSGKSHGIAIALVLAAGERKMRILCAREVQKSIATSSKQLIQDKIIELGWGPQETGGNGFFSFTDRVIRGQNGSEFLFMGLKTNPDSVKSTEGIDIVWLEEANKVSQRSIDLLGPTIRKPGSEIWASYNPELASDPIHRLREDLARDRPDEALTVEMNWRDNPFFPDELRNDMEWDKSRDLDKYMHIWEGGLIARSEAKVFSNWVEDDLDDKVRASGARPLFGADWGTRDPTVLVECYAWPGERLIYFRNEAYKVGASIDEYPSLFAGSDYREPPRWENPFQHPGVDNVMMNQIVADSSRPDTITYMKDRGFSIVGAARGANSIEEGVEFLKSYDIVIHPRCKHVRDEFQLYSYKVDKQTEEILPELADKDNHTIDAARYALESTRRAAVARKRGFGGEPTLFVGDG
ncbi:MAG: PBSX family phage terminase large subunit [Cyanobacteria bacterium J06638_20]